MENHCQRKRRFDLLALLSFEAADASEPFIGKMLAEIAKATGIRFQLESSLMHVGKGEQGVRLQKSFLLLRWSGRS